MTKRELVYQTLQHIQCETVPYQVDLTGELEKTLLREVGNDFLHSYQNCLSIECVGTLENIDLKRRKDQFGVIWSMDQRGDIGVVDNCLLPEPTCDSYIFPEPDEALIRNKCESLIMKKEQDTYTMFLIGFSLFERAWTLRGMENLLIDMVAEPLFVHNLLDKIVEYNLQVIEIALEYPIDGFFFGDDWGQQKGLIMGPLHWRRFLKPALKKMYDRVADKGISICQHSCGDIEEVFKDLIDMGLHIYNTFQPEIYDVEKIKKEYGQFLTFYGGISTQHVLPYGTVDQVKKETQYMINTMGKEGGYIVAPTHAMPGDIPVENVLAFLEVVQNQKG